MNKLIMVSFVCSFIAVLMVNGAFAEPYNGKAFPERQVVRESCKNRPDCQYLGKFKEQDGLYNVYFQGIDHNSESGIGINKVFQLDTGIWIFVNGRSGNRIIIQQ